MDLMVLPNDPAFPIEDAPFVCVHDWDCGTFITYPLRTHQLHWVDDRVQNNFPELSPPVACEWRAAAENREPVFQEWLFFGLMAEFLALNDRDDGTRIVDLEIAKQELAHLVRDCVRTEGDGKILVGRPFLRHRQKMLHRFMQEGSNQIARARHLSRCLNFAREMVRWSDLGLRESVRYSVAALGQLLVYTLRNMCREAGLNILLEKGFWSSWATRLTYTKTPLWDQMIRAGWCPGALDGFKYQFGYLSGMHYVSRLKLPPSRFTHEGCTSTSCTAAQIRPANYELMHIYGDCTCDVSGVDQAKIIQILRQDEGAFPVLRLVRMESSSRVDVIVEACREDVPYVSISHVWADGLGNPFANSLQSCQLLRVLNYVTSLGKENQTEYRIWLDTLCCPIEVSGKKIALERMARVYRDAAHVLVLDAALTSFQYDGLSGPEKYLRVLGTSSWMKRLWTLQEGAFSRSLFFQFAERAVSLVELKKLCFEHDSDDELGSLCQNAREMFEGMQMWTEKDPENKATDKPLLSRMLSSLVNGIRYRSVSVATDEPLCIATMLGLNTKRVLEFDELEDRMRIVWALAVEAHGGYPADSVFFSGYDTLSIPGWRWAPRTLLKSGSDATWSLYDRRYGFNSPQMGIVVPRGLEVYFPSQLLRITPWTSKLRTDVWQHLSSRPRYPIIMRDSSNGRLSMLSLDFVGLPKTLPDMSIQHTVARSREFVILHSTGLPVQRCMLARAQDDNPIGETTDQAVNPMPINFVAHLLLRELPEAGKIFYENILALAEEAASHETSTNLSQNYDRDGSVNTKAADEVKNYMRTLTARRLDENEAFRQIALRYLDKGESLENVWEAIPIVCPFRAEFQGLPEDRRYIID